MPQARTVPLLAAKARNVKGSPVTEERKVRSFFIMDENFLLYRKRVMERLDYMKAKGNAWVSYVFSSANAVAKYTMRDLVVW